METRMEILQRPIMTLKDNQQLGRWDRLEVYLGDHNDPERPTTTLLFHLCHMETKQIPLATANDPERLSTTGSE